MHGKVLFISERQFIESYSQLFVEDADSECRTLREPLDFLPLGSSDIVVLDCGLDSPQGIETLRNIKKLYPRLPVVFITADSSGDAAVDAFRSGAREFFRKPANVFELQDTIGRLIRLKLSAGESRSPMLHSDSHEATGPLALTTTRQPGNFLRAVRYMEENLCGKISLNDLARESGLSKYHFCRQFGRRFGTSPMDYVASMRIRHAKELLMQDGVTVSSVAFDLGYDSPGSFIRQFRKHTGLTPARYRRLGGQP